MLEEKHRGYYGNAKMDLLTYLTRLTSLYVVPFTYKLYFTQVIFTAHMVPDR